MGETIRACCTNVLTLHLWRGGGGTKHCGCRYVKENLVAPCGLQWLTHFGFRYEKGKLLVAAFHVLCCMQGRDQVPSKLQ